jgi:hypothetical protein
MNAHCGAIVSRSHLHSSQRRMALVTESLADVRADLYDSVGGSHCRKRKTSKRYVVKLPAVKKRYGWPEDILSGTGIQRLHGWASRWIPLAVHVVTTEAGDYEVICQLRVTQSPRAFGVDRRQQVTNSAVEMHRMAA